MSKLIRGGTVVTASEMFEADVLIEGEKVAWIGQGADVDAEVIDAQGCYVMPGLVDNHTHLSMPFGGTMTSDDFNTGTAAAAAGGTTTIVDFALQTDGSILKGLETWHEKADGKAHIDYGFHLGITDATDEAVAEIPQAIEGGVSTFKLFMAYKNALMVDDEEILKVFEAMSKTGALPMVHAENGDAVAFLQDQAFAAGNTSPEFHAHTRPTYVEAEATARAIRLATVADSPLFVVHVSCEEAIDEIERARALGLPVHAETCIHYLILTIDELKRPGFEGAKYVCSPPLREAHHRDELWTALSHGVLGIVSTDHCPFNFEGQKDLGKDDFRAIPNGVPTIESRLALLHEFGVRRGRLTMPEVVRLASTEPAKLFGLAGRKGAIAPGADADIVIFDPEKETTISADTHVMNMDYDLFEGYKVRGLPRTVLSRGDVVYENGKIVSQPGRGKYLHRECVGDALRAPAEAAGSKERF